MTAIGATSSMNKPTRSRRISRNSLAIVNHTARSIIASVKPGRSSWDAPRSWSVAQRVASELQKRVLQIGTMHMEFDHLVANFDGAANDVGHLFEVIQGGRGRETVDDLPWHFGDARDPFRPSRRQRFFCHDFNLRFRSRQRDQFAVGALRNYVSVIDEYDPIAQPFRFFHVVRTVKDRAAGLSCLLDDRENFSARLWIERA